DRASSRKAERIPQQSAGEIVEGGEEIGAVDVARAGAVDRPDIGRIAAGQAVGDARADELFDAGEAADAGGRPRTQIDGHAGGVQRIIKRIDPAAAIDVAADAHAITERESISRRATHKILEARKIE